MSPYETGHNFTHWRFPSAAERVEEVITTRGIGRIAWQMDDDSLWLMTPLGWINIASYASYTATKSFDGESIPLAKQHIVYGAYEIVGSLELNGDLVIL